MRLTIGGDKLDYFDETASLAASLLETKLILNSAISDAHKRRMVHVFRRERIFFVITFISRPTRAHEN